MIDDAGRSRGDVHRRAGAARAAVDAEAAERDGARGRHVDALRAAAAGATAEAADDDPLRRP